MIIKERATEKVAHPKSETADMLEVLWKDTMIRKLDAKKGLLNKKDLGELKSNGSKSALEKFPEMKPNVFDAIYEEKMDEYVHDLAIKEGNALMVAHSMKFARSLRKLADFLRSFTAPVSSTAAKRTSWRRSRSAVPATHSFSIRSSIKTRRKHSCSITTSRRFP
jgi:hypothetical protein